MDVINLPYRVMTMGGITQVFVNYVDHHERYVCVIIVHGSAA